MTTKFGEFSEPGYLKPGATYQKTVRSKDNTPTDTGSRPSLRVGQALKSGKLGDATFSKFVSTNIGLGDGLLEPAQSAGKEFKSAGAPFKPASPMKKAAAEQAGDFNGTFSKIEYVKGTAEPKRKKGDFKSEPRNICAHAARSGGYGTNNATLSQLKGSKGVAGEYEYMADPIHAAKRAPKDTPAHGPPFRPAQGTSRTGVFNQLLYQAPAPQDKLTKQKVEEKQHKGPAFAPPSAGRPALTPIPYLANPIPQPEPHKKSEAASKASWRPGAGSRSGFSPSIMRMNV